MFPDADHDAKRASPVRPLLVPINPKPGESIAGMLAHATRANVLGSTQIILAEIGLPLAHPGTIAQEVGDRSSALAAVLGLSEQEITERTTSYAGQDGGGPIVRFGSGTLRRRDLILGSRRISPVSLTQSAHHRASWAVRHLP